MNKLHYASLLLIGGLIGCKNEKPAPNVLFILTDQWRSSAFSYAGDENVKTPYIDRFASEAVRFTNAVSVCPVCTPARASLLTGRYPTSTGMFLNDAYLPEEELCLAEIFKARGYQTGYIGKWHLDGHGREDFTPPERRQGFEYWKALECSHEYNRMPYYEGNDSVVKYWEGYSPFAVCRDAEQYITTHRSDKSPFFLFVSIAAPHFPHQTAPEEFKAMYPPDQIKINPNVPDSMKAIARRELQGYYAHCTAIDQAVGELLEKVKELGLWDETLIVFTSDHGEIMGAHGARATQKQVPWIESAGVPLIVRYPDGRKHENKILEMAVTTPDISATLVDLCRIDIPETFEGTSFAGNILKGRDNTGSYALYMTVAPFAAVRKEYKREYRALRSPEYTYVKGIDGPWLLYDDKKDPFQQDNLVSDPAYSDVLAVMDGKLTGELNRIGDDFRPARSHIREWGYTVEPAGHIRYTQHDQKPQKPTREPRSPRIVNIINFIRQCEPRIDWITPDVLYETVVSQVEIMKEFNLKGTFLLQYDALIDPRYQQLLKSLPPDQFEIGAWWEIPQPLVEKAGYVWRGRYPWDWEAHVGFSTGYTPEEREKLANTYMADFKSIFGYYPKSVGSWFIDAHTLNYLYENYGIVASCNCKDQIGTDGYTLWGGYWNQGYYPSKKNAYMPAQNAENQIPVPVFRMLGSDPIHQYDNGLGGDVQRVVSLEPVYKGGGGNTDWCNWYYSAFVDGPAMAYGYTQTGQENSFTWKKMEQGFRIQLPIIARLLSERKIVVKTLGETGEWFRDKYPVTPPTSVTVLNDHTPKDLKTVWFNSRYYRANLLWDKGTLRFRDIHLFDENVESDYLTKKGTSTQCIYYTLPVVDGFQWSTDEDIAGLRFKWMNKDSIMDITGGDPVVDDHEEGVLRVTWPTTRPAGEISILFDEAGISISSQGRSLRKWLLVLNYADGREVPISQTGSSEIKYNYKGYDYSLKLNQGDIITDSPRNILLQPERGNLKISMKPLT